MDMFLISGQCMVFNEGASGSGYMAKLSFSTLQLFRGLNCLSLVGASAVVVGICFLAWKKPKSASRVSLKLQLVISLIDITRHILLLGIGVENEILCTIIAFYAVFVDNLYMFLNVAIAGNLLCLVFFEWTPHKKYTLLYLIGSIALSFLIVLVPLGMGALGRNQHNICYIAKSITISEKFFYFVFLVYLPIIPSTLFCFLAPIITNTYIHLGHIPQGIRFTDIGSTIKSLVLRVSIYPFSSLFCIGGYTLIIIQLGIYNEATVGATYWSLIGLRSTGLVNLLAFLLDPAFFDLIYILFGIHEPNPILQISEKVLYEPILDEDCQFQAPPSTPNPEPFVRPYHRVTPPEYVHINPEFSKLMAYLDLY